MNILENIIQRRTIHSYTEDQVPRNILDDMIQAAIHAPNHKMTMPWVFIHAGPKSRQKLANLILDIKSKEGAVTDAVAMALQQKYTKEGTLIVPVQKITGDDNVRKEDYAAMACAIQNMSLYLWSQGYGSKWSTGSIIRHSQTFEILDLKQDRHEIVGFFWCGKARGSIKPQLRPAGQNFLIELS